VCLVAPPPPPPHPHHCPTLTPADQACPEWLYADSPHRSQENSSGPSFCLSRLIVLRPRALRRRFLALLLTLFPEASRYSFPLLRAVRWCLGTAHAAIMSPSWKARCFFPTSLALALAQAPLRGELLGYVNFLWRDVSPFSCYDFSQLPNAPLPMPLTLEGVVPPSMTFCPFPSTPSPQTALAYSFLPFSASSLRSRPAAT